MTVESIFLDSNVFMYAAGKPHPYKEPCLSILRDVEGKTLRAAINTEILQELLYRYSHIGLADKGIELCRQILEYPLTILPVSETGMRNAVDLFESHQGLGIRPRDAVHAATMRENELRVIASADKHFDAFEGLERLDPADYGSKIPAPEAPEAATGSTPAAEDESDS